MNAAGSLRRRYHLLLALRFVPVGLLLTVFVLLMQQRGLTLADIGVGTAAQGVVMLVLELPSGGLADALGRKPVLVVATAIGLVATAGLLVVDSVGLLAVVFALLGVFRALDSGPLQAWFVDELLELDPAADLGRELSRADVVISVAIGGGALLGSGIVRALSSIGVDPLVAPIVTSVALQAIGLLAVITLMHEHVDARWRWGAARRSVLQVPSVVRQAATTIRATPLLLALAVAELLWGFGMVTFETFFPARLAETSGGADAAAGLVGPLIAAAWVLSAIGAACAPLLSRLVGAAWTGCSLRIVHGATVVGMGLAAGTVGLVAGYLACYWAHGASNPVHYGLVHDAADRQHRATIISANSLASQLGGAAGGIALGALAVATSTGFGMIVGGLVLAAAAPLYLVSRPPRVPARIGAGREVRPPAHAGLAHGVPVNDREPGRDRGPLGSA